MALHCLSPFSPKLTIFSTRDLDNPPLLYNPSFFIPASLLFQEVIEKKKDVVCVPNELLVGGAAGRAFGIVFVSFHALSDMSS
ncbi:hypothetical protein VNO80_09365 [Phaseolus coccineus]|uniref:Uncharacterized protein n=1 Tax=Phaseolus coccineus TaxID=3886 RepID=A0AAN9RDL9_PHACN